MLILAIDTASDQGSAALCRDGEVIEAQEGGLGETYSSRLFRWLRTIHESTNGGLSKIDGLAVTVGPGSFTGLRIGIAAAKGIALASACPVVPFSTLAAMSHAAGPGPELRCPVLTAGRGYVYTAVYRLQTRKAQLISEERVIKPDEINLQAPPEPIMVFGNGLEACLPHLPMEDKQGLIVKGRHKPAAPTIALLAAREIEQGRGIKPSEIKINYIKHSYAHKKEEQ